MFHLHISLKQRLSIVIIGMAVIAACIIFFIIIPITKKISALGQDIYETERFMEAQYQRTKHLKKSINSMEEIEKSTKIFERSAIKPGEELRVITELEELAEKFNVSQSLTIKQVNQGSKLNLPSITLSFSNNGSFTDHARLIRAMEQLPYYLFIDKMSFEKQKNESVSMRFEAKIYISQIE